MMDVFLYNYERKQMVQYIFEIKPTLLVPG